MKRRSFLVAGAQAALPAPAETPSRSDLVTASLETVRVGFVGTGIYDHIGRDVHVQGRSPGEWTVQGRKSAPRQWEPISKYYGEFEHPLWRDLGDQARSSGHGGGDFLCFYRMIEALRTGTYPDIDVYDTAAWSSIVGLSEWSARNRSRPIDCPDFTRGRWKNRAPLPIRGA